MKYTLIRLTTKGFIEHKNVTARIVSPGKIHTTVDGELYTFVNPSADMVKTKAIMLNKAIGAAQSRIKAAQVEIEKLRGLKGGSHA